MNPTQPRKFTFDTVFDGDRVIAPPKPKRTFTAEEVETARAEGYAAGQRSVQARAETDAAAALGDAARAIRAALSQLAERVAEHKVGSARLAVVAAQRIADAALDRFPEEPAVAALNALAREIEAQPRLVVRASAGQAERMKTALDRAAEQSGFAGQVLVKVDANLPPAAFSFDWGEGRAAFDPTSAAERVAAALEEALAADGLHAEPLSLDLEDQT